MEKLIMVRNGIVISGTTALVLLGDIPIYRYTVTVTLRVTSKCVFC